MVGIKIKIIECFSKLDVKFPKYERRNGKMCSSEHSLGKFTTIRKTSNF